MIGGGFTFTSRGSSPLVSRLLLTTLFASERALRIQENELKDQIFKEAIAKAICARLSSEEECRAIAEGSPRRRSRGTPLWAARTSTAGASYRTADLNSHRKDVKFLPIPDVSRDNLAWSVPGSSTQLKSRASISISDADACTPNQKADYTYIIITSATHVTPGLIV